MTRPGRQLAGFTLLELLIVICLMTVLAALVLPGSLSGSPDYLKAVAQIVAGDLDYGRSLAVANNSSYRFTFDLAGNTYALQHSGATASLHVLPQFPFSGPRDTPTRHVVALSDLPGLGSPVRLEAVIVSGNTLQAVSDVEFGPLGGTTRSGTTTIWLSTGQGAAKRYISVSIHPVTGLATIGPYSAYGPPPGLAQTASSGGST